MSNSTIVKPQISFTDEQKEEIREAFQRLMGMNGDPFKKEIFTTGKLSQRSYEVICNNISYNGESSIKEHFGLVHWYYLQGLRK
jgi:hypothetical protein